jgi:hypothetical protein
VQQKIHALEAQIAGIGQQAELRHHILDWGLSYHWVTRRRSLYAPDNDIIVDPEPEIALCHGSATVAGGRGVDRDMVWQRV